MTHLHRLSHCNPQPGPALLVLGAVHGDERCGPDGIALLQQDIADGRLRLSRGNVTFVPICNPIAYAAGRRFVTENLNRIIRRHDVPANPEQRYANELCDLIESHDVVLDLHSYHAGTEPFLFLDRSDACHVALAARLPYAWHVTGWDDLYADQTDLNHGDTIAYAHRHGKTAILVECGAHGWEGGAALAARTVRQALRHLDMIGNETIAIPSAFNTVRMRALVTRRPGAVFAKDWRHLDRVAQGEVLTRFSDGRPCDVAPFDCFLVIPHQEAETGKEWLYYGVQA